MDGEWFCFVVINETLAGERERERELHPLAEADVEMNEQPGKNCGGGSLASGGWPSCLP